MYLPISVGSIVVIRPRALADRCRLIRRPHPGRVSILFTHRTYRREKNLTRGRGNEWDYRRD